MAAWQRLAIGSGGRMLYPNFERVLESGKRRDYTKYHHITFASGGGAIGRS